MPRRRVLSLGAYTRRKWRAVGLTAVLMVATLFYLSITDRGHEPEWRERVGDVEQVSASPDGSVLLVVGRTGDRVTSLAGYAMADGERLWERDVNLTAPVSVAAGDGWFAVSSPFPRARLIALDADEGDELVSEFLDGEPRAVVADGRVLVVALRSGAIEVREDMQPSFTVRVPGVVSSVHAAGGLVAAATTDGRVLVVERGREIVNTTVPLQVHSMRLTRDGARLYVGGLATPEAGLGGGVTAFHLDSGSPGTPAWHHATSGRIGLVDTDATGRRVVALEETLPRYTLLGWNTERAFTPAWSRTVDGAVVRDDAGLSGGVDLSPDGRLVAVATSLDGRILLLDASTGGAQWAFLADGASSVSFPSNVASGTFASNARLVPTRPFDHVLTFNAASEPFHARWPTFALVLVAVEAVGGAAVVGAGYWWYRRS